MEAELGDKVTYTVGFNKKIFKGTYIGMTRYEDFETDYLIIDEEGRTFRVSTRSIIELIKNPARGGVKTG